MRTHQRTRATWAIGLALGGILAARQAGAWQSALVTDEQSSAEVRQLFSEGRTVSGVVANTSPAPLRDVRLLLRCNWLWKNEFHPGNAGPGTAAYLTIPTEIPPGEAARFEMPACSGGSRGDGRFEPSVEVVGFTEVLPGLTQR